MYLVRISTGMSDETVHWPLAETGINTFWNQQKQFPFKGMIWNLYTWSESKYEMMHSNNN